MLGNTHLCWFKHTFNHMNFPLFPPVSQIASTVLPLTCFGSILHGICAVGIPHSWAPPPQRRPSQQLGKPPGEQLVSKAPHFYHYWGWTVVFCNNRILRTHFSKTMLHIYVVSLADNNHYFIRAHLVIRANLAESVTLWIRSQSSGPGFWLSLWCLCHEWQRGKSL